MCRTTLTPEIFFPSSPFSLPQKQMTARRRSSLITHHTTRDSSSQRKAYHYAMVRSENLSGVVFNKIRCDRRGSKRGVGEVVDEPFVSSTFVYNNRHHCEVLCPTSLQQQRIVRCCANEQHMWLQAALSITLRLPLSLPPRACTLSGAHKRLFVCGLQYRMKPQWMQYLMGHFAKEQLFLLNKPTKKKCAFPVIGDNSA